MTDRRHTAPQLLVVEEMTGQGYGREAPPRPPSGVEDEVVDAVISASRALVAVAARSLAGVAEDVTLPQYRTLVVLVSRGPQRVADLADALGVLPSTATRMLDRLVAKNLVRRARRAQDRRSVRVVPTVTGRELVAEVTRRRRAEIGRVMREIPRDDWDGLASALHLFARSAGEVDERDWPWEWQEPPATDHEHTSDA